MLKFFGVRAGRGSHFCPGRGGAGRASLLCTANNDHDNDGSPSQMLELNVDDRLHLQTGSIEGDVYDVYFCINMLLVA